eukprot:582005-Amorphochlora_amoeboformis.AAC.2
MIIDIQNFRSRDDVALSISSLKHFLNAPRTGIIDFCPVMLKCENRAALVAWLRICAAAAANAYHLNSSHSA